MILAFGSLAILGLLFSLSLLAADAFRGYKFRARGPACPAPHRARRGSQQQQPKATPMASRSGPRVSLSEASSGGEGSLPEPPPLQLPWDERVARNLLGGGSVRWQ